MKAWIYIGSQGDISDYAVQDGDMFVAYRNNRVPRLAWQTWDAPAEGYFEGYMADWWRTPSEEEQEAIITEYIVWLLTR